MPLSPEARSARLGPCGCTWSWSGSAWCPAGSGTAPSCAIRPSWTTTARVISGLQRAELVRDEQHRAAAVDEAAAAPRRTPPGWPRRRRRSARRARAARARPARARAISARCCWPPDSVADRVVRPGRPARPRPAPRRRPPVVGASWPAAAAAGPAGRRPRPRRPSPARRCRRRAAGARSRCARHCPESRRSGVAEQPDRRRGPAAPGRGPPGPASTCRSRWRRGWPPPRRRRRQDTPSQHRPAVVGDDRALDLAATGAHRHPKAVAESARLARMTER